jgi:hypothetical protein
MINALGAPEARPPIYLIMDNAGGHGTRDAIDPYITKKKEKSFPVSLCR